MRVLVTGAGGFVGGHLVAHLAGLGHQVWAGVREGETPPSGAVEPVICELDQAEALRQLMERLRPEAVIHLAGLSSVGESWRQPAEAIRVNTVGTTTLLESLVAAGQPPTFLSVGSAEEYGEGADSPLTEESPTRPLNPYGVSKLAQGMLALQYGRRHGFRVIHVRAFNHVGPGQRPGFVLPDFARQVALIERGKGEPTLRVGNLTARRDFLDVRDVVRAYAGLLAPQVPAGVYNVASGTARPVSDLLDLLLAEASCPIRVERDPSRFRPADVPVLCGDPRKLREATGWSPIYPLEETVRSVLAEWRGQV
ncbi:MAG: GDP-mannose 4,6-dehydratase [Bacillota bacterium]